MAEKVKEKLMGELTKDEFTALEKQHGKLFTIEGEGKVCYLKRPGRRELKHAGSEGVDDITYNEILMRDCFVAGDKAFLDDDYYFLGAMGKLSEVLEYAQVELKK